MSYNNDENIALMDKVQAAMIKVAKYENKLKNTISNLRIISDRVTPAEMAKMPTLDADGNPKLNDDGQPLMEITQIPEKRRKPIDNRTFQEFTNPDRKKIYDYSKTKIDPLLAETDKLTDP